MPTTPLFRESAAKSDDQIAYENAVSCEEVGRHQSALEWHAEVKPTGGKWDLSASASRVAILIANNRANEGVGLGMQAILRMQQPCAGLIAEVARAWNANGSSIQALELCRLWLRHPTACCSPGLWFSAAAFASQCRQFGRCLRYLVEFLHLSAGSLRNDLLFDQDFAPLWHHLANEPLTLEEAVALRCPEWLSNRKALIQAWDHLSFESIGHVPPTLRAILNVDTCSMTWRPRQNAEPSKVTAYHAWRDAVRVQARENLDTGLIKALAVKPISSGKCS